MSVIWKTLASLCSLALLASCSEPVVDPGLEDQLETAAPSEVEPLIATAATQLGVTALSVTILEGSGEPRSYYFGRAKEGGAF